MESGQLRPGQSLITEDNLQKMGDDLVRLCDNIERHGLVDYQYGVWEQQIEDSTFPDPFSVLSTGSWAPRLTCCKPSYRGVQRPFPS